MTSEVALELACGAGLLVRREHALLFLPAGTHGNGGALAEAFERATSAAAARDDVTDAVVAAGFEVDPFVLVSWSDGFHAVVLGAVELRSDAPALPMLSGAGSATWVERRLARLPDVLVCEVGAAPVAGTDLRLGRVPADGFRATIPSVAVGRETAAGPPPAPAATVVPAPDPAPPAPERSPDPARPTAVEPPGDERQRGLAALRAATGDWMEDSLGLGPVDEPTPPPLETIGPETNRDGSTDHRTDDGTANDETTLGADDLPLAPRPSGPPVWPETGGNPARESGGTRASDPRGLIAARRCPDGHPNPPHALQCRTCGRSIDEATPTASVPQPALGTLVTSDGNRHRIDRPIIVGRTPEPARARADTHAALVALDADQSVSRTHLCVRAEGWTITVTDCGSKSGTALVGGDGGEPVVLSPWVPHEVQPGATVYLGGPTQLTIEASDAPEGDDG